MFTIAILRKVGIKSIREMQTDGKFKAVANIKWMEWCD